MHNAALQKSKSKLRKHGGDYIDTKPSEVPEPLSVGSRSMSSNCRKNMMQASDVGVANGAAPLSDAETGNESDKRVIEKSLRLQQRELKRIMQS